MSIKFDYNQYLEKDLFLSKIFLIESKEIRNFIQLILYSRCLNPETKLKTINIIAEKKCPWIYPYIEYLWEYFQLPKYTKNNTYIFTEWRIPICIICDSQDLLYYI